MSNHFGNVLASLCFIGFSCTLFGQYTEESVLGGTILAFTVEEERILVASDSRESNLFDPQKKFNDHSCKITPLGERMFFAATGSVDQGEKKRGGEPVYTYQAHKSAKLAYQRFQAERNTALR